MVVLRRGVRPAACGMRRLGPWLAGLCWAVGILVVLTGCGDNATSRTLDILRADPLAEYSPPGTRELDRSTVAEGTTLGKPRRAELTRILSLPATDPTGRRSVGLIVDAARRAGWSIRWVTADRTEARLTRHNGDAALTGAVDTIPPEIHRRAEVEGRLLHILLRHELP